MYQLINKNIETLLDDIKRDTHIDPYLRICQLFLKGQSDTEEFRSLYRKFYQMNAARLSGHFCESYFSLLEESRNSDPIDIERITERLYQVETNSKRQRAVNFSFASKLVHTVDNTRPVYDSAVATFFFFPSIKYQWTKERKLQEYLGSYAFLEREYNRILEQHLLKPSIEEFRERFSIGAEYTDIKVIDTLLWRYTALLKTGAVRNGTIQYD